MSTNAHEILKKYMDVPEDVSLKDMGLDSIDILEFITEVESVYEVDLINFRLERGGTLRDVLDAISFQKTSVEG